MCMFETINMDCNKDCPKQIKALCESDFSQQLQDIISLAVREARYQTLNEIYTYLDNWNVYQEIKPVPYSGETIEHTELKRSGAEMIKDDLKCEILYKMQDEDDMISKYIDKIS